MSGSPVAGFPSRNASDQSNKEHFGVSISLGLACTADDSVPLPPPCGPCAGKNCPSRIALVTDLTKKRAQVPAICCISMSSGNGQPPRKKQRQMESTPLALQHLAAHTVSFPEVLSPGALHSCRIAAAVRSAVSQCSPRNKPIVCSTNSKPGAHLPCPTHAHLPFCSVQAPLDLQTAVSYELYAASGRRVYCLCAPRPPSGTAFAGERGKEGVYIPAHGKPLAAGPLEGLPHRAEVQELRLAEDPATPGAAVLASVDCYGRAVLAHMRRGYGDGGGGGGVEAENAEGGDPAYQLAGLHQVQPPDLLR